MPVNPNEAPEGFVAEEVEIGSTCNGCAFEPTIDEGVCDVVFPCMRWYRDDKCNVVFVPCTNRPATANWPHDDMGTPV